MQIDLEIGGLPVGDGDGPSYGRVAVVDHFHLVLAGAQLHLLMLTSFAHRMVIDEDIGLLWGSSNSELAVLSKT